jgi:formylglycine-generating enzyme required for sulfatase activity
MLVRALLLVVALVQGRVVRVEREPSRTVPVEGGTFTMGLSPDDRDTLQSACQLLHGDQRSQVAFINGNGLGYCEEFGGMMSLMLEREVSVDAFEIDRHEVTIEDYRACVLAGSCGIDPLIDGDERYNADGLPLVNVTWPEAKTYCAWRGGRLPTEAEWEKAARGEDARRWPWGDIERPDDWNHGALPPEATVAVDDMAGRNTIVNGRINFTDFADPDDSDGYRYAAPPGSFLWDEGAYGTHDLAGNVAEWVLDEYTLEGYDGLSTSNPARNPDGGADVARVVRGGSWRDPMLYGQSFARSAMNRFINGDQRHPHIGFRCVYEAT